MAVENEMEAVFKSSRAEKDPVSGNDVPPGSLPEEVRDDIPAQLSEGEYVVPADVVRYYGVKFFEDLRMQAKMGFEEMDAQGRIGGEPMDGMEIVEPEDDLPFDLEDLEVIEVIEMDEGGDVARRGWCRWCLGQTGRWRRLEGVRSRRRDQQCARGAMETQTE